VGAVTISTAVAWLLLDMGALALIGIALWRAGWWWR
jgi:hypothetical protein